MVTGIPSVFVMLDSSKFPLASKSEHQKRWPGRRTIFWYVSNVTRERLPFLRVGAVEQWLRVLRVITSRRRNRSIDNPPATVGHFVHYHFQLGFRIVNRVAFRGKFRNGVLIGGNVIIRPLRFEMSTQVEDQHKGFVPFFGCAPPVRRTIFMWIGHQPHEGFNPEPGAVLPCDYAPIDLFPHGRSQGRVNVQVKRQGFTDGDIMWQCPSGRW